MQHAHPPLGRGRASPPPPARPARADPSHAGTGDPGGGESEGRARVFVGRALLALASLGIGSPASRELLRAMLHFLPPGALTSGRPWLPMGAAKLAAVAGITERSLARRVAELRGLGLLERHLDRWNHPARAGDGARCGYDLGPLVARAAALNAGLDALFDDHARARREARRCASREAAEAAGTAATPATADGTPVTGGDDVRVTPLQTTYSALAPTGVLCRDFLGCLRGRERTAVSPAEGR